MNLDFPAGDHCSQGVVDVSAGQPGTLEQLINGTGQGSQDPSCRSLSRFSSIKSAEFSGN